MIENKNSDKKTEDNQNVICVDDEVQFISKGFKAVSGKKRP
jgi:hypothetical protein